MGFEAKIYVRCTSTRWISAVSLAHNGIPFSSTICRLVCILILWEGVQKVQWLRAELTCSVENGSGATSRQEFRCTVGGSPSLIPSSSSLAQPLKPLEDVVRKILEATNRQKF